MLCGVGQGMDGSPENVLKVGGAVLSGDLGGGVKCGRRAPAIGIAGELP